jgi:dipeptidyl aminopeptidase/acylaminoacyl peptidase
VTTSYGAWPSPIRAADVADGVRPTFPQLVPVEGGVPEVWWTESRPAESGRQVVVRRGADGVVRDVLPAPWNARSRVHEYGGLSWLVVGGALVFCEFTDQRVWRLEPGERDPLPLTPLPTEAATLRYADLSIVGQELWCVRERHDGASVSRHLVAVPLDGSQVVRELVGGSDFLAHPRVSPDGAHLAWLAWDHPQMPWDGTELRVAALGADGTVGIPRTLLGGTQESVLQPEWADSSTLYAVTDRSGWWNLVRLTVDGGSPEPLHGGEEEFGAPLWQLGQTTYALLEDGRLAVTHGVGKAALGLLDPRDGSLVDLKVPFPSFQSSVRSLGGLIVGIGISPTAPTAVVIVDPGTGTVEVVDREENDVPGAQWLSVPTDEALPGPDGRVVHALVHPPTNPVAVAPEGERPPYVVFVHGGPTAQSVASMSKEKAFFTSRGIGVLDVNYAGSSGYGRAYRNALREQWGVADVQDCVAAAQALVADGRADGARLVIRGGSAGGWTVLSALTRTDTFASGTSYYGVADLLDLVADTHDFESRYMDGLIGPLPQMRERYVERAPLSHVDGLSCPVLLLQGDEDEVVPPSQSEMFRDALVNKGIPHAYLLFHGEQHGFRKAETIVAALLAELSFYGQVLGFSPPGVPLLELTATRASGQNKQARSTPR